MAKKTSTALTVVQTPAPAAEIPAPTLASLAATIREAMVEMEGAAFDALQAAIKLGQAAMQAKDQLPKGEFLPWIEKHCTKSQPWVAACMNAARVEALLHDKSQKEQKRLREGANSIEAFAALYRPLKAGDADPLNPTTKKPTRKPRKAQPVTAQPAPWPPTGAPVGAPVDDVTDVVYISPQREANVREDLAAQRAELDERERKLVMREADVVERENLLAEREQALAQREAALEAARQQALHEGWLATGVADTGDQQDTGEGATITEWQADVPAADGPAEAPAPQATEEPIKVKRSRKAAIVKAATEAGKATKASRKARKAKGEPEQPAAL